MQLYYIYKCSILTPWTWPVSQAETCWRINW